MCLRFSSFRTFECSILQVILFSLCFLWDDNWYIIEKKNMKDEVTWATSHISAPYIVYK